MEILDRAIDRVGRRWSTGQGRMINKVVRGFGEGTGAQVQSLIAR